MMRALPLDSIARPSKRGSWRASDLQRPDIQTSRFVDAVTRVGTPGDHIRIGRFRSGDQATGYSRPRRLLSRNSRCNKSGLAPLGTRSLHGRTCPSVLVEFPIAPCALLLYGVANWLQRPYLSLGESACPQGAERATLWRARPRRLGSFGDAVASQRRVDSRQPLALKRSRSGKCMPGMLLILARSGGGFGAAGRHVGGAGCVRR
jgi:hypothetical protein